MKTKLFFFFFVFSSFCVQSQTSDSIFDYKTDQILSKILKSLPKGWTFYEQKGELIIEKNDSIVIAEKAQIGVAANKKVSQDSVLKYGYKSKSRIIYKYSTRWTYEQTLNANSNNTKIYQQIKELPTKYKITNLFDKGKSSRNKNVYTGKTDEEKKIILQYEKEKGLLTSKLILIPNYHTDNYSLFLLSTSGVNNNFVTVYPNEASLQLNDILNLFYELTEKSFLPK
jgi:hypothetical protein